MHKIKSSLVSYQKHKMPTETDPLIQTEEGTDEKRRSIKWKHITILPAMFFTFVGGGIFGFIINEWTQNKIQNERFPNMTTKNNFEACNNTNHSDPVYINYKAVQQDSSIWLLYYSIAQHIPMFLVNIVLTGYTDTYGRKFLFVLATFGACAKYCVITVVIHFNASLWYATAMQAFDGFLGSSFALFAVSFSFVADITHKDNHRVLGVVIIDALLISTGIFSSLLSGYFIETLKYGFFNTAVISSSICLLGFFLIILFLPETLDKSKRQPPKSLFGTMKNMIQFYVSEDFKGKRLIYLLLLASLFFAVSRTHIEILYFLGQPFCWGPSKIGVFTMTRLALLGVIGLGSLRLLQIFLSNEAIAVLSTVSLAASFMIEAFAKTNLLIYMVPVAGIFSFLMTPMIRGMMSTMTEPDKQGAMFSGIATIEVLSSISASLSFNKIYADTYSFMNGFVFLVMAGFYVIDFALLMAVYLLKKCKKNNYTKSELQNCENCTMNNCQCRANLHRESIKLSVL
ncbi:solute carrier family 46 member 3-like [Mercenaria mercenaria]|uniref:solute carrier family 46 member 3-like n=1 Tax=Mercenaria mercenaria TaxID=6596 RepID=UPI00234EBCB1|nr:solute carrier family 46 member 3-like [Mercenaria mercenaria]XP_045190795.2 solute carrier family 46 member 3-like [Mercenaria mercenaria]